MIRTTRRLAAVLAVGFGLSLLAAVAPSPASAEGEQTCQFDGLDGQDHGQGGSHRLPVCLAP
jgi:hypothetical protein